MLEAHLLTKNYGHVRAVREASFTIRPGEILGFLGANGAGKTTTIKMLTGLIEPSEGQILYNGHSIYEDLAAYQRRLGYVPEEAYLYPHLSGREYLQLVGRLRGMPRNVLDPKLDELLEIFGLWDDRFAALSSYSKGMRQKILLSAALIHNPEVLILDEPFSGLDVTSALMLRRLVSGLAERGKMVLYSSHALEVVEKVCSKVLILRHGEVVAYDSIDPLREMMRQPSLEGVFAQLVHAQGEECSADRILQVVTSDEPHMPGPKRPREMSLVPVGTPASARGSSKFRGLWKSATRAATRYPDDFAQDLKRSLRTLAASPGFTAVALLSLSMGICIAACAFSEMNGMVLRNVPVVSKPDELVALEWPATYPEYKRYRERNNVFASAAAYIAPVPFTVSFGGRRERIWGHLVSSSYFSTLGVAPTLGRLFGTTEEKSGLAPEAVVSYRFWEEQLGRDSTIVGKALQVNGNACTVIGVGPKDFLGASPALYVADLWIPVTAGSKLAPELENDALERDDLALFHVVGRLKPGVSVERAETELDVVARQVELEHNVPSNLDKSRRITLAEGGRLLPLRKEDLPFFTSFFLIMAGLVMLIACANVANMVLARGTHRRREIAVRLALGAGRGRLVRLLGTESMLIAVGAGIIGFAMSIWIMNISSHLRMPFPMPVSYDLRPDWRVLLLTLAITTLAGFGFGLIPAMRATQGDLVPALKQGGEVLVAGLRPLTLRNLLMVAQLAGSLTLLVILGLLSLGIRTTLDIQAGFNPRSLYLVSVDPIRDGYSGDQSSAFLQKLLERVKALPSVTSATLTESVPVSLGVAGLRFAEPLSESNKSRTLHDALKNIVGTDYFDTAGIPILKGRNFRREDENNNSSVVIVSEELVREYWPGENPVGRTIEIENAQAFPAKVMPGYFDYRPAVSKDEARTYEVVGVVGDVANDLLINKKRAAVYFPLRNSDLSTPSLQGITLMVRAAPGSNTPEMLRREISALDPNVVPFHGRSMNERIAEFMAPMRAAVWTYGVIGIFGLLLASVGLAGMTAYSVAQRRREIGIRMALGARRGDVVRTIMKDGAMLIGAGTIIGLGCAWAGSRMLSAMNSSVQQVTTTRTSDPVVLFGAPVLLALVALIACYLPARQSSRINPLKVLHEE